MKQFLHFCSNGVVSKIRPTAKLKSDAILVQFYQASNQTLLKEDFAYCSIHLVVGGITRLQCGNCKS